MTLPHVDDVLDGWRFYARRQGLEETARAPIVMLALEYARELVKAEADEPAALFYAFACHPRAFVGGWRAMPARLAINHAAMQRKRFVGSVDDLTEWHRRIAGNGRPDFPILRDWFADQLEPR